MRVLIALLFLAAPAWAKEIAPPLTDEEQAALMRILDVATKAGGLEIAPVTLHFANKIKTYQQQADKPAAPGPGK